MARQRSLQSHLALGVAIPVLVATLSAVVLVGVGARELVNDFLVTRLHHDLETLIGKVRVTDNRAEIEQRRLTLVYDQPYSGHYFQIRVADAAPLRSRSLWDTSLRLPALEPGQRQVQRVDGPAGQTLLLLAEGARKSGTLVVAGVAEDIEPQRRIVRMMQLGVGGIGVLVVILTILAQTGLIHRTLRPVHELRRDLRRLDRGDIDSLNVDPVPREIAPLVREFNELVGLMASRLSRSRKSLGNLAHALKTPLTVLDGLRNDSNVSANPHLYDELTRQLEHMRGIVERELRRARLAGGVVPGQSLAPLEALDELRAVLARIYADKAPTIELEGDPNLRLAWDREDFLELAGALLDNACKWCRSRVRVRMRADDAAPRLVIEDDGAGCPPEHRERLKQRGWRLDERKPGSGLGLDIAQDVLRQYEGGLEFAASSLGGLRVIATLAPHGELDDDQSAEAGKEENPRLE